MRGIMSALSKPMESPRGPAHDSEEVLVQWTLSGNFYKPGFLGYGSIEKGRKERRGSAVHSHNKHWTQRHRKELSLFIVIRAYCSWAVLKCGKTNCETWRAPRGTSRVLSAALVLGPRVIPRGRPASTSFVWTRRGQVINPSHRMFPARFMLRCDILLY